MTSRCSLTLQLGIVLGLSIAGFAALSFLVDRLSREVDRREQQHAEQAQPALSAFGINEPSSDGLSRSLEQARDQLAELEALIAARKNPDEDRLIEDAATVIAQLSSFSNADDDPAADQRALVVASKRTTDALVDRLIRALKEDLKAEVAATRDAIQELRATTLRACEKIPVRRVRAIGVRTRKAS